MILPRIFRAPEQTFFLLDPRGTGKSTWLRALFPQAHWVNLLDGDAYQRFRHCRRRGIWGGRDG
ncbi:MAG: hypothetical protein RMM51_08120 [Verrucomicrobiae bacterium]|nr:hypothetical protein [Verrucomicrobiae bacterium]